MTKSEMRVKALEDVLCALVNGATDAGKDSTGQHGAEHGEGSARLGQ